ncbi:hypothetical protein B0H17DRAFT_1220092 [Mycena rosella]|uniref:Uncharacterized protein n=1 Tax=Mycena rosella TaxID=1033263 RepID=A0AAD7BDL4_MYCRO|nr:hypothetical protein B0H17DRAFT_1220092 [Mycena rosella]
MAHSVNSSSASTAYEDPEDLPHKEQLQRPLSQMSISLFASDHVAQDVSSGSQTSESEDGPPHKRQKCFGFPEEDMLDAICKEEWEQDYWAAAMGVSQESVNEEIELDLLVWELGYELYGADYEADLAYTQHVCRRKIIFGSCYCFDEPAPYFYRDCCSHEEIEFDERESLWIDTYQFIANEEIMHEDQAEEERQQVHTVQEQRLRDEEEAWTCFYRA